MREETIKSEINTIKKAKKKGQKNTLKKAQKSELNTLKRPKKLK